MVRYLQESGFPQADRSPLRGVRDLGDVVGMPGVIEVKNHRTFALAEWVDQMLAACKRRGTGGVVWHKRRGKGSPADWYVTCTGAQYVELLKEVRSARW